MSQVQWFGFSVGLYLLVGVIVIWIRWHFGFLRATVYGVASQFGASPDRIRLILPFAVLFWPLFAKGIITDPIDMRKAMKNAKITEGRKCDCGGTQNISPSDIRKAITTGFCMVKCASCGKITEVEAGIRYTESSKS